MICKYDFALEYHESPEAATLSNEICKGVDLQTPSKDSSPLHLVLSLCICQLIHRQMSRHYVKAICKEGAQVNIQSFVNRLIMRGHGNCSIPAPERKV